MELYLKKRNSNVTAVGKYDFISGTMTVKKGSVVSDDVHADGKFRSAKSVIRYRESYCDGNIVEKDAIFKSASTAANFVTGCSTNGLVAWKDSNGRTLREIVAEEHHD